LDVAASMARIEMVLNDFIVAPKWPFGPTVVV
jgi:hypothetical protein